MLTLFAWFCIGIMWGMIVVVVIDAVYNVWRNRGTQP